MPIYEYECRDCGHQFEAMRKVSAGPPDACPSCGEDALQKLVSRVAFRLKGTGWYETDFKTKPAEKDKKTNGGAEPDKAASKDKPESDSAPSKSAASDDKPKKTPAKTED